ncbi:MAG TPA: hypothetical protein VFJ19_02615 [Nocardioidaceae bacterium]|nr:hypothetical protein [Nocardioidaceae bacterium]
MSAHPLLPALLAAARGTFPPVDGQAVFAPPLPGGLEAVVSFTGHAVLATELTQARFADLAIDGLGTALHPEVLLRLAGARGTIGVVDVTLVGHGLGGGQLPARTDLDDHARVRQARSLRRNVRVHGDDRGLVTLAEGLAGRLEMSVEADPSLQEGPGTGRELVIEALRLVPPGEPVFAAVSPGNARSMRAFLAVGFHPLGSEVLVRPDRRPATSRACRA